MFYRKQFNETSNYILLYFWFIIQLIISYFLNIILLINIYRTEYITDILFKINTYIYIDNGHRNHRSLII